MPTAPTVLDADEALDVIGRGLAQESLGPFADRPVIAVRVIPGEALDEFARVTRRLPCVVMGVGEPGLSVPDLDLLVTANANPVRPWVGGVEEDALCKLVSAVESNPQAAVTLVQLLRLGASLDPFDALVAESLAFGLLQAGGEHHGWLLTRPEQRGAAASGRPPVRVERESDILTITLDRPERRNAFNTEMRDLLVESLAVAASDPSIASIRLRGIGDVFCSGGDLAEFGLVPDAVSGHLVRTTRSVGASLLAVADRVTAHVHGACVGAGVELPAFAHRVVARSDATFRLPEVGMGLIPGAGGTVSIRRRIGGPRTAWLALTNETLDAGTALAWGLVDKLHG